MDAHAGVMPGGESSREGSALPVVRTGVVGDVGGCVRGGCGSGVGGASGGDCGAESGGC